MPSIRHVDVHDDVDSPMTIVGTSTTQSVGITRRQAPLPVCANDASFALTFSTMLSRFAASFLFQMQLQRMIGQNFQDDVSDLPFYNHLCLNAHIQNLREANVIHASLQTGYVLAHQNHSMPSS
jgi:hypothetical protein